MIIPRALEKTITHQLQTSSKSIGIYGPRQVGKTTLVQTILKQVSGRILTVTGDNYDIHPVFAHHSLSELQQFVEGYDLLFIDEAQRIPEIGIGIKLILDSTKTKVIFTGSSSLDLISKVSEPLTGRIWTHSLFPIWQGELRFQQSLFDLNQSLTDALVYGSYPELFSFTSRTEKEAYLDTLQNSYLLKDVFELSTIGDPAKLMRLLKLLAFQIGSEVSISELATQLQLNRDTVERYISLLEDTFVLFRLGGFSKNLRKEVTKMDKLYFWDLGIRNSIIGDYRSLNDRNDTGALWENFLVIERQKRNSYLTYRVHPYFWRTYTGGKIDYIEETAGKLYGYELKWSKTKARVPPSWENTYSEASFEVISRENWEGFVMGEGKGTEIASNRKN